MNHQTLYPDPLLVRLSHWVGFMAIWVLEHYQRMSTSVGVITIPTGFESDGLSIPSFAWPLVGPASGPAFRAGLLHDFLYSKASNAKWGHIDRKTADVLFKEAMYNLDIGWVRREMIYLSVRAFGWKFYKKR